MIRSANGILKSIRGSTGWQARVRENEHGEAIPAVKPGGAGADRDLGGGRRHAAIHLWVLGRSRVTISRESRRSWKGADHRVGGAGRHLRSGFDMGLRAHELRQRDLGRSEPAHAAAGQATKGQSGAGASRGWGSSRSAHC